MSTFRLEFFREAEDGTRVGHVDVEGVETKDAAKRKFLRQVREADVASEADYTFT